jgi:hypothetical protein
MLRIASLADGLGPVRQWFNEQSAFPRVLAIQSAT